MKTGFKDITGQKFGKLTAIKYLGGKKKEWQCKCECNREKIIDGWSLRKGIVRSCGQSKCWLPLRRATQKENRMEEMKIKFQHRGEFVPTTLQAKALKALAKAEKQGIKKGIIALPTGTGKTAMSVAWFKKKLEKNCNLRLLFICHSNDIISQANEREFQKWLHEFDLGFGYYNGYKKEKTPVLFATTQTLVRHLKEFKPNHFDYIICDESHHNGALNFRQVVTYFKPEFMLSLTATPYRMDNISLRPYIGNVVFHSKIKDAIGQGLLCPLKYYVVDNDMNFDDVRWTGRQYSHKDFNRKFCIRQHDEAVFKEYEEWAVKTFNRKKTIAFCTTVAHAHHLSEYFQKRGIKTIAMTGMRVGTIKTNRKRTEAIELFRKGNYKIIFTVNIFNEGIDIPECDCVMMLRPTKSSIIFTQQIGRGLRKATGKDFLLALDFSGNSKRCYLNFEALNEIIGDITKQYKGVQIKANYNLVALSNGCEIRMTKKKLDILNKQRTQKIVIKNVKKVLPKLIGKKFGSLRVIKQLPEKYRKNNVYLARCETCKQERKVTRQMMKNRTRKCVCNKTKILDNIERKHLKITKNYMPLVKLPKHLTQAIARGRRAYGSAIIKKRSADWSGYRFTNSPNKNRIRNKIIAEVHDGDRVLMLESPSLYALKELKSQGIRPKKVIIPNNVEFQPLAHALLKYETGFDVELVNTSALQYLADCKEEFDFVWLDYCGAFSYYIRDLDILFNKGYKMLRLVLTYCVYDLKKTDDAYYYTRVIDYVLTKNDGGHIKLLSNISRRYKKNMYNIAFEIRREKK